MMKFNYNVFRSNCNSLSKQFNQVHSTCVVYHDICQQSVTRPLSQTPNVQDCDANSNQGHEFHCQKQTCSSDPENNSTNLNEDCKTFSTNTKTHHHHHNHEHGLIYSKRVRSILLLNALLSKPSDQGLIPKESSLVDTHQPHSSPLHSLGNKWQQIRNYAKKTGLKDKKKGVKKVDYSDEELSECIDLNRFRNEIDLVIQNLKSDFVASINIRMGSNIELLKVANESDTYLLKDIARLTKKNNLISIDLTDLPEFMAPVMKAIQESGMNVNPQQDGTRIYFQQVKSTKENREILAKNCKMIFQKAKDNLRKVQNSHMDRANLKKADKISSVTIANCCEYIRYAIVEATTECKDLYEQKVKQLLDQ